MNSQRKHVADENLHNSPLGKAQQYPDQYDPSLLYAVPRAVGRTPLGLESNLPFVGVDIWNIYELSWLGPSGRPVMAMAELRVPVNSPCLIESKSMKLYCNSLNMTTFADAAEVQAVLAKDLSVSAGVSVGVQIRDFRGLTTVLAEPLGLCIDDFPLSKLHAEPCSSVLQCLGETRQEILYSCLFRSRCPVTGQPDWATIIVEYSGRALDPGSLLEYLVSYRRHQSFHEACVEQIYIDIQQHCRPDRLQVTARFTRRGGIDINPVRATHESRWENIRTPFQ